MNVIAKERVQIKPLTQHIGAEITGIDLRKTPDRETVGKIYSAWLDHLVLVFPGQELSQEDLLRVTAYFGEPGHLDRIAHIENLLAESLPTVVLAGAALRGLGLPACINQGRGAARTVLGV